MGYCRVECGGCDQSIGSTDSDAIVRGWLWSTATRSSLLGYICKLLQVVDNWTHILLYSIFSTGRLLAIEETHALFIYRFRGWAEWVTWFTLHFLFIIDENGKSTRALPIYPEWPHRQSVGLAFRRSHVRISVSAVSLVICSPHWTVQFLDLSGYCPV